MSSSSAGSSSSSSGTSLNITISEKLTEENCLLWQTQVLLEIYGVQLYGYLDGLIEAPGKETIVKDKDSMVIRLKRIYNFLCSMLVLHQLLCVLFTLRGIFMHFSELTY
jgi:hypothetical protein